MRGGTRIIGQFVVVTGLMVLPSVIQAQTGACIREDKDIVTCEDGVGQQECLQEPSTQWRDDTCASSGEWDGACSGPESCLLYAADGGSDSSAIACAESGPGEPPGRMDNIPRPAGGSGNRCDRSSRPSHRVQAQRADRPSPDPPTITRTVANAGSVPSRPSVPP